MGTSRTEVRESAPSTRTVCIRDVPLTMISLQCDDDHEPVVMPFNLAMSAPLLLECCRKLLIATDGMYNEADWQQIKDEVIAMQEAVKFATR